MNLIVAQKDEFRSVRNFYWSVIDLMEADNNAIGWIKGIYPSDELLQSSVDNGNMYLVRQCDRIVSAVILNDMCNEGYGSVRWGCDCSQNEILVPHALAVHPHFQGRGIGSEVVSDIIDTAKEMGKKVIRLDTLKTNTIAKKLYEKSGFRFVGDNALYYPDTGLTEFSMFEYIL